MARRMSKEIAHCNETRLTHSSPRTGVKDLWTAVRHLTLRKERLEVADGITAESLNQHYARVSTDPCYQLPKRKLTTASRAGTEKLIIEIRMFAILDKLHNTATGMNLFPARFLCLGALVFSGPLAACSVSPSLLLWSLNSGSWHLLHQLQRPPCRRNMPTTGPSLSRLS